MLTEEYINSQLAQGLVVNFATTDQTIQAAQQNQQQLLAQTTIIDEQYVLQHPSAEELVQVQYSQPQQQLTNETQVIVTNTTNRVSRVGGVSKQTHDLKMSLRKC